MGLGWGVGDSPSEGIGDTGDTGMCCVRERLPGGLLASLRVSLEPSRTMLSMPGAPLCGRGCLGCLPILMLGRACWGA